MINTWQYLTDLTPAERVELARLAKKAGMSVPEWVEFFNKAQIYRDANMGLTNKESSDIMKNTPADPMRDLDATAVILTAHRIRRFSD